MGVRLVAALAAAAGVAICLTACGGPDPADTCRDAFRIVNEAKIDPRQWALNRAAPTSIPEGRQKAQALSTVAALKTDDKDLQTSLAHLHGGVTTYLQELDKLAGDPSRTPNVQLAGSSIGFFLIDLGQRCTRKGFTP